MAAAFCTAAIDGQHFQAIFVCHSCSDPSDHQCVCRACAETCHAGHHGLHYLGMGRADCDCQRMSDCRLKEASMEQANQLGVVARSEAVNSSNEVLMGEVYHIPALEHSELANQLQASAKELVQHSKETFWLDSDTDTSSFCDLEQLAWMLWQRHDKQSGIAGAEWWVQYKSVSHDNAIVPDNRQEAVDMHYDKDEELAADFGLGRFPWRSTVTYLTNSIGAPPTVVLKRCYHDDSDMDQVLVSHPRLGKHLVFDGRLLHGAPAAYELRESSPPQEQVRITFLVNLWRSRPCGVHRLPLEIRSCLPTSNVLPLSFIKRQVAVHAIEGDGPRIELPFVGNAATWGGDEDEDEALVVNLQVPPQLECDTVLFRYREESTAYISSLNSESDNSD